ncbi:sensor histidine kinase [Halalkalibacter oceani]|uniref:histidine kinase n=1 Tax=Halalkalibacter oceani TaxID=1653776 RepID=A0A9X2INL8_9BACI|nr:HAMP domain-containing sensor histidine kinase [Halalkalibacter oceani]MCM3713931.1 HAMP domain-containing histidine kinase [Halalkalibacter oceani]
MNEIFFVLILVSFAWLLGYLYQGFKKWNRVDVLVYIVIIVLLGAFAFSGLARSLSTSPALYTGFVFQYALLAGVMLLLGYWLNGKAPQTDQSRKKRENSGEQDDSFWIFVCDENETILMANRVLLTFSAVPIKRLTSHTLAAFVAPSSREKASALIDESQKHQWAEAVLTLQNRQGDTYEIFFTVYCLKGKGEGSFLFIGKSIQQHKALTLAKARAAFEKEFEYASLLSVQLAHELKIPLNSILGYAQLMQLEADRNNRKQQERLEKIIKSGKHMLFLLNAMSRKRGKTGQLQKREKVNVFQVIDDSIMFVYPFALEKNIEIIRQMDEEHELFLQVDRTKFMQILLNLLTNGIKFNKKNGTLTIQTERKEDQFRLMITDSGFGIAEEKLEDIFHLTGRADHDEKEGQGMGLALTKGLVEEMGGEITVESRLNQGSTFSVSLPLHGSKHKMD